MTPLSQATRDREVLLFVGSGGVGKTTIAAATALYAAQKRETLVLTVDPAKRLASALGLEVGHEVRTVRPGLNAAMVDTRRALDDLVRQYARDEAHYRRVTEARYYQVLTDAMAGSEEFAAMGLLHELVASGKYELILVDTPPGPQGLGFLTVNDRLLRVFESGLARVLFQPGRLLSLFGARFLGALAGWTDRAFLEDLAHFMAQFESMFLEMRHRVDRMHELLGDAHRTGVILVTTPEPGVVRSTVGVLARLYEMDRAPLVTVLNRYLPPLQGASADDPILEHYRAWARSHQQGLHELRDVAGRVWPVPALGPVVGLEGLERLHPFLFR